MKIITLTNQKFLKEELKKSENFSDLYFIENVEEIFNLNLDDKKFIFLNHLDTKSENIDDVKNNFKHCQLIALRNNTNNIEGCTLLKKGYKAYAHSTSNIKILEDIIFAVLNGNTWIYPELMQFLIQSVPLNDKQQNKILEKLTVKELEVFELVAQGLNNSQIAKTLDLAEVTVKKHIGSLFKKLEVKDRLSLALAFKNYK